MPHFRPLPGMSIATILGLVVLIALGTWQLQRRTEKNALIAAIEDERARPPVALDLALARQNPLYAKVQFELPSDCTAQVWVNAFRNQKGQTVPGATLVTAATLPSGKTILIVRGFVQQAQIDAWSGQPDAAPCPQTISGIGIITPSAEPGMFTPAADQAHRRWYAYDAHDIARAQGLTLETTNFIRLQPGPDAKAIPIAEDYAVDLPNNHLVYALTWFGLAMTLVGVYLAFHAAHGRLRFLA